MSPAAFAILLLALGLIFLVLEFFIPSGGSLAVLCALSLLGAIIVGFMAGPWTGMSILLTEAVVVPAALAAAVKWWPDTPIGRMILIPRPASPDEVLPETENYRGLKDLVGKRGTARGLMVPSGIVLIENRPYDAVSEGTTIEAGQNVLVVGVSTQRLVVRPDTTIRAELVEPAAAAASSDPLAQQIADPFAE
ncbi:MAG: NfeD family protein [Planctomycetaceae bacterium]|nr:NfeD family protein [Planctomycetaceae bacterium]